MLLPWATARQLMGGIKLKLPRLLLLHTGERYSQITAYAKAVVAAGDDDSIRILADQFVAPKPLKSSCIV
jgi:hypothetical protein